MDLNYINPFISSCLSVISDITKDECKKEKLEITSGYSQAGDFAIKINMTGDVKGVVYIDLEKSIATRLTEQLFQELDVSNQDEELLFSGIQELGNLLVGNTIKLLANNQFKVDLSSPELLHKSDDPRIPSSEKVIQIGFLTPHGRFSIHLYNELEKNILPPVTLMTWGIDSRFVDDLVDYFVPRGVTILKGYAKSISHNDKQCVAHNTKLMEKNRVDVVMIDYNTLGTKLSNIEHKVFQSNTFKKMPIILYAIDKPKEDGFIQELEQFNLIGYILKRNSPARSIVAVRHSLINNGGFGDIQRETIRVAPAEKTCRITLQLYNHNVQVNGFIDDISYTGIACTLNETSLIDSQKGQGRGQPSSPPKLETTISSMTKGEKIERITMSLEGKLVISAGAVARKLDAPNQLGLVHKPVNESYKKNLLKYISEKMSEL